MHTWIEPENDAVLLKSWKVGSSPNDNEPGGGGPVSLVVMEGRRCINTLNAVPIRQVYERWVSPYQDLWASKLTSLKKSLESPRKTPKK